MQSKIGQTFVKIKNVLQHITQIVKTEFSKKDETGKDDGFTTYQKKNNVENYKKQRQANSSSRTGVKTVGVNKEQVMRNKDKNVEMLEHEVQAHNKKINDNEGHKSGIKESRGELTASHIINKIGGLKQEQFGVDRKESSTNQKLSNEKLKSQGLMIQEATNYKNAKRNKLQPEKTMNDFKYISEQKTAVNLQTEDKQLNQKRMEELKTELSEALQKWKWSKEAYNYALGADQVEYCIYQMMAAEQKYRMTLLKARALEVEWSKVKGDLV